ncbi:MAG: hypothetical protein HN750_11420 [Gemmatimonadales bacterium]|nr:hypothetical protein [Gemmatimonadota bacterium]MBT7692614.1 hypothetical protein [Gemmatimonadales bacterium]
MPNFSDLLATLDDVRPEGNSYLARCPAHTDNKPSLLLTLEPSGRLLLYCRAGCHTPTVVDSLGMKMADLFNMKVGDASTSTTTVGPKAPPTDDHLAALSSYCDAANAAYKGSPAATYAAERFGIGEDLGYYIGLGYDDGTVEFTFLTPTYHRAPRLVVPFANFDGIVHGLQGRALCDDAIRWCGPRNPAGHVWSTLGVTDLDGDEANFMVTEGPGDRLTAVGAGYSAVGIRGAALARNTDTVATLAANLHGRRVVLCGDNDESGIDFNLSMGASLAAHGHQVHTLAIATGNDLTAWREADPDAFDADLRRGLRAATRIDANAADGAPPDDPGDDGAPPTGSGDFLPMTDEGNAMRVLTITGGYARWCPELGWLLYSDGVWERDTHHQILNAVSIICSVMRAEGSAMVNQGETVGDPDLVDHGERLIGWARRSENSPRFGNAIKHAEPKAAIDFNRLDKRDELLVVANGTVNLKTGDLGEHDASHWMTHAVPHEYNPEAVAPRWRQFLLEVFDGDATMVAFLQRLIGYALSGSTREQCFAVLYGTGANGKSVLLNVLEHVLGDMVGVAAFSAFELKGAGASTADLASLRGRRIVIAQEGERSRPMAEAVLKRVTGGDRITCRHLYRDEMTYRPNFLLLLASNYRPRFGGQDDGLWRRVKLIPFNRYFTPDGRDPYLTETLITEADGILAWAIEGAVEWYESGLGDPPAIIAATQDYKETSDELAGFVGWEVVSDRRGEIKGSALYEAYRVWADHEGVKPWTKRALYEAVAERMPGIRKVKRQDGVWMQGLRLAAAADRNDEHDVTDGLNNSFGFPDSSLFEGVSERGSEPSCASSSVDEAAQ